LLVICGEGCALTGCTPAAALKLGRKRPAGMRTAASAVLRRGAAAKPIEKSGKASAPQCSSASPFRSALRANAPRIQSVFELQTAIIEWPRSNPRTLREAEEDWGRS
jgi:hypothetical protein